MSLTRRSLMKEPIRVLFVSKHRMVQDGLKLLIESSGEISVSAAISFDSGIDLDHFEHEPEVAVISLTQDAPMEFIPELLESLPDLRIVVIVSGDDLDLQAHALELGAVGIVKEDQSPALLIEAIRQTHSGETWLNQVTLSKIFQRKRSGDEGSAKSQGALGAALETLTDRELEVLDLIGTGLKNKQIAERLMITEPTVRSHLSSIYSKLGVNDRLNLVIKAYEVGLLEL